MVCPSLACLSVTCQGGRVTGEYEDDNGQKINLQRKVEFEPWWRSGMSHMHKFFFLSKVKKMGDIEKSRTVICQYRTPDIFKENRRLTYIPSMLNSGTQLYDLGCIFL
jgi:hypothetical protein